MDDRAQAEKWFRIRQAESDKDEALTHRHTKIIETDLISGKRAIPRTYDAEHLRLIHQHLFAEAPGKSDIAGQWRTVDMGRFDGIRMFARTENNNPEMKQMLNVIELYLENTDWENIEKSDMVQTMSELYTYLNYAHAFRDGNGRTARVFLSHVADRTKFTLDYTHIATAKGREEWTQASEASRNGGINDLQPEELHPLFEKIIRPRQLTPNHEPAASMSKNAHVGLNHIRQSPASAKQHITDTERRNISPNRSSLNTQKQSDPPGR